MLALLSQKFCHLLLNPHFEQMSLLPNSSKSIDATRRESPQAPTPSTHWSTPVQTTCASPSSLSEWTVSPRPTSPCMHWTCHLSPDQRDSSKNYSIFFSLSVFSLLCSGSHQHIKDASSWRDRNFSLWFFLQWLMPHFSASIYNKTSVFAVSNSTSFIVSWTPWNHAFTLHRNLLHPGDQ